MLADPTNSVRFRITALCVPLIACTLLLLQAEVQWMQLFRVARGYSFGVVLVVLIWLLGQFIWVRLRQKRAASGGEEGDAMEWYRAYARTVNWGDIICAMIALIATTSIFTTFKASVVGAGGYGYDALFIAWDRAIFAGRDPWVLTHGLFASPTATKIIDILYHPAFLPMVLGYTVCVAASGRPALRYTYMLSYLICFVVIGMISASALHSAGPIYDGALFGDGTTFGPLVDRLAAQDAAAGPFSAVFAQEYLLTLNSRGITDLGGGISAMPSMHIVLAFLWVFAAWHLSRVLGVIVTLYALLIWAGSVHLGWHYFVDGLVGLIMLAVIWAIVGRVFGLYGSAQVMRATT